MNQDHGLPDTYREEPHSASASAAARLAALRAKEWSIGSGQCPACRGVNDAWHGHPLYTDPGKIGHSSWCKLAAKIKELGGMPLYVGTYQTDIKYETYWKTFIDRQGLEHRLLGSRRLNG
ncbi:MAG: hypothetical protein C0613_02230 [Desulfobulbaceae bacterium]|nr:MAG: hypothetical protein C0613_02230 [Desulfobulbaceae bacterium]